MMYQVKVSRDGHWWVAEIPGLRGGATETRRLADLEGEVRDLIAGLTDVDDDAFELTWDLSVALGPEGDALYRAFLQVRDDLHEHQHRFDSFRLATLDAFQSAGLSVRDTATLVGLSHQRVAQLLELQRAIDPPVEVDEAGDIGAPLRHIEAMGPVEYAAFIEPSAAERAGIHELHGKG